MDKKRVYTFGNGQAEGKAGMRNLLGGKGANLAEMNLIGVPVPPGFTITTEVCTEYYEMGQDKVVALLKNEVEQAIAHVETLMRSKFGDVENPLLVSVRSGARASMPGMMDTILNLGLNDEVVEGLTRKTGNARFAWDSYRRFVQMYGDVVLGMKPVNKEDVDPFEAIIEEVKHAKGVKLDNELEVEDLKELVKKFKAAVKEQTGKDFPTCAYEQLWGAVCAVFNSWMNERAILYRKMEGIPDEWGTAVSVQAMVFGNMGESSATGVCFSRDAATGEDLFNGEYLINAQGEDVVAGIRTPQQITKIGSQRWAQLAGVSEEERAAKYPSMEEAMPEIYKELDELQTKLENHYHDMQDMEFTVQEGKLWFLQTRNGKRTGAAMVKIAMDLLHQGMIDEKTALLRCEPNKLDELLHPVFDKAALKQAQVLTRGLPASPGAACGQIVFFADDAAEWHAAGKRVVMVRIETSPEDLAGMAVAEGILTARGGMTSHAAVVARGMGKCCVSGAGALNIDYKARTVEVDGVVLKEGDFISLNGSTGEVYKGKVETKAAELSGDFAELMQLADNSIVTALVGKLIPQTVTFFIMATFYNVYLYGFLHYPCHSGIFPMLLAGLLLVLASQAFGVFLFGLFGSLRLALSAASLWGVISFSISGFTFPVMAMHPTLQALSVLFPLRHYFLLYVNLALNGYPVIYAWHAVTALLLFMLLPFFFLKRIRTAMLHYVYIP